MNDKEIYTNKSKSVEFLLHCAKQRRRIALEAANEINFECGLIENISRLKLLGT